jgi:flagellar motor component MotA
MGAISIVAGVVGGIVEEGSKLHPVRRVIEAIFVYGAVIGTFLEVMRLEEEGVLP